MTRARFGAVLDALKHPYFGKLREDVKDKILAYLNEPSLLGWRGIEGIVIGQRGNYFTSVYVVVKELDSTFRDYMASYFQYPDALTVARALQKFAREG